MTTTTASAAAAAAVTCRDIDFWYSSPQKSILNKLCMTIPRGAIYSLLGASSAGKTTLIRIINGTLSARHGSVTIFGEPLGGERCTVPGPDIGYMPQDLCLNTHFTIDGTLRYFGRINRMSTRRIAERIDELRRCFELPDDLGQPINRLSGGQQRRVSLAIALIHSPPLMILDEPTVGIDPLLRCKIWTLLRELRQIGHTILITTHYIEESVDSDVVAYMRNGRLICEQNPRTLMQMVGSARLEDALYDMCSATDQRTRNDKSPHANDIEIVDVFASTSSCGSSGIDSNSRSSSRNSANSNDIVDNISQNTSNSKNTSDSNNTCNSNDTGNSDNTLTSITTTTTTTITNDQKSPSKIASRFTSFSVVLARTCRLLAFDWFNLFTLLFYPSIVLMMFSLSFYKLPPVRVTILNRDSPIVSGENETASFGDMLVQEFAQRTNLYTMADTPDQLIPSITRGSKSATAAIKFGRNFTECFVDRMVEGALASDEQLSCSQIGTYLNTSEFVNFWILILRSFDAFRGAIARFTSSFGYTNVRAFMPPIDILDAADGRDATLEFAMKKFFITGQITGLNFMFTFTMSGLVWLKDRHDGVIERSRVQGVRPFQFFFAHLFVQMVMMLASNLILLSIGVRLFDIERAHAPTFSALITCFALLTLQTLVGILLGQFIAFVSPNHMICLILMTVIFYPSIFVGGLIWPMESITVDAVRAVSNLLPMTQSTNAIRALILRKMSLSSGPVFDAFRTLLITAVTLFAACVFRVTR